MGVSYTSSKIHVRDLELLLNVENINCLCFSSFFPNTICMDLTLFQHKLLVHQEFHIHLDPCELEFLPEDLVYGTILVCFELDRVLKQYDVAPSQMLFPLLRQDRIPTHSHSLRRPVQ